MSDIRTRWALYRYHNRSHDGEIWFAFSTPRGLLLMEQSGDWPEPSNSFLLGEVRTRMVENGFVDDVIPLQERSVKELQQMQEQTAEHKKYRARL